MSLSKIVLIIVGAILVLMGIMAIMGWPMAYLKAGTEYGEPMWHAIAKIVVGAIAIVIPFIDKK
jgi:hypothetical protein